MAGIVNDLMGELIAQIFFDRAEWFYCAEFRRKPDGVGGGVSGGGVGGGVPDGVKVTTPLSFDSLFAES